MSLERPALKTEILASAPGTTRLAIQGVIDDGADLAALARVSTPVLYLDLAGVRRITSFGVRDWIIGLRRIPPGVEVVWERVSVPLVAQLGMIANFSERSRIDTFFAPYYCARCDEDVRVLLGIGDIDAGQLAAPARTCPKCAAALTFDELETDYFAFIAGTL